MVQILSPFSTLFVFLRIGGVSMFFFYQSKKVHITT